MKIKSQYVCGACGYVAAKWVGRCPDCGAWNSLTEEKTSSAAQQRSQSGFHTLSLGGPVPLEEINLDKTPRYTSNIPELDRVLGG